MSRPRLLAYVALGLALASLPFLHFIAGHHAGHGDTDVVASHTD